MWFELLALIAGGAFGYLRRGKEDVAALVKQGLCIGIVLGLVLGLLSIFTPGGMSFGSGIEGVIGMAVRVIILVLIFIIGVMIGDFLEMRKKQSA